VKSRCPAFGECPLIRLKDGRTKQFFGGDGLLAKAARKPSESAALPESRAVYNRIYSAAKFLKWRKQVHLRIA
jgi:hypothetical protein